MSRAYGAPQQHKQPSRKGKRAWRKNVDIGDVQAGLEQLRGEIITGGPISEKPSDEIFAVDTRGSQAVRDTYQKTHKPLKAEQILAQRSAVPAVGSRKRSSSKTTDGITEPSHKKLKKDWVSSKELQRLKASLNETNHLSTGLLQSIQGLEFDLWAGDCTAKDDAMYDYLEHPKPKVAPPTISRPPIAMTASGKSVKAVKLPPAGSSYNPSFADWDDLLNQEGQKVVEAERKRLEIEQLEAEHAARIAAEAHDREETGPTEDESAWEGFESDYGSAGWLNKKRPVRKTQAQRNKIKRRKEAERLAAHLANMANKKKQARELELLRKEDAETADLRDQVAIAEDGDSRMEDGSDSELRRKHLRNVAIPKKSLEVVLPDELQESLRRLKPEGNLLNDRFRHLLVNGKIEARRPVVQHKKKRVTYTEKWTYKDFHIPV